MTSDTAWLALAILAPLGLAAVVGLLRGYAVRVLIWRQTKGEDPGPNSAQGLEDRAGEDGDR